MNDVAEIGHNSPPAVSDDAELITFMQEASVAMAKLAEDIIEGVDNMPKKIDDDATAEKAAAFIKQIGQLQKKAKDQHDEIKSPYLKAGKAVDTFYREKFTEKLDRAKKAAATILNPYLDMKDRMAKEEARKEQERLDAEAKAAREEAEKLQNEGKHFASEEAQLKADDVAQAAERAGQAPKGPLLRSSLGATASVKREWTGEIKNVLRLDLDALRIHISTDELEKAVKRFVKAGGRELKGARIFEKVGSNVR